MNLISAIFFAGMCVGCRTAAPQAALSPGTRPSTSRSSSENPAASVSLDAAPSSNRPDCPKDKAVVSLTYDDGLLSQLTNALPALNEYGFKATFFLNDVSADMEPWKKVKAAGHELGSHTLAHPCTAAFDWVKPGNASEDFDLNRMSSELDTQIQMLRSLGQEAPISFAYPCGTTWIGKEHTSYLPLVEERFIAARGVEGDIVTQWASPMNVPAYFLEGPAQALIERVDAAIDAKGWVVFGFHGVGGDHLPVSIEDHLALMQYLAVHKGEAAVLPFGDAARCMKERFERPPTSDSTN